MNIFRVFNTISYPLFIYLLLFSRRNLVESSGSSTKPKSGSDGSAKASTCRTNSSGSTNVKSGSGRSGSVATPPTNLAGSSSPSTPGARVSTGSTHTRTNASGTGRGRGTPGSGVASAAISGGARTGGAAALTGGQPAGANANATAKGGSEAHRGGDGSQVTTPPSGGSDCQSGGGAPVTTPPANTNEGQTNVNGALVSSIYENHFPSAAFTHPGLDFETAESEDAKSGSAAPPSEDAGKTAGEPAEASLTVPAPEDSGAKVAAEGASGAKPAETTPAVPVSTAAPETHVAAPSAPAEPVSTGSPAEPAKETAPATHVTPVKEEAAPVVKEPAKEAAMAPPVELKLFKDDCNGNAVEMVETTDYEWKDVSGCHRYGFKEGVQCVKVMFDSHELWKKGNEGVNEPKSVSYNSDEHNILVFDHKKFVFYKKDNSGNWVHDSTVDITSSGSSDLSKLLLSSVPVKLFKNDPSDSSKIVEMESSSYDVKGTLKHTTYMFKEDAICSLVKCDDKEVWKTDENDIKSPKFVTYYNNWDNTIAIGDGKKAVFYHLGDSDWKHLSTIAYKTEGNSDELVVNSNGKSFNYKKGPDGKWEYEKTGDGTNSTTNESNESTM